MTTITTLGMRPSAWITLLLVTLMLGQSSSAQETQRSAAPSWEELRERPYPQWFSDAKLGIFIHWGVYSVVAYGGKESYGEWLLRGLQTGDTIRTHYVRDQFGEGFDYRDLAPLFKAELFDPAEWAELFAGAGARYVVLVTKHHDGYALWPSQYSPGWNSMDAGPGRDLVGELTDAVRDAGLRMGFYYSLAEWNNALHRWYTDPPDSIAPYVEQYMIPQFKELVSTYKPIVLFSDGEWLNTAEQWHARELIDWYYDEVGPDGIVNDRWGAGSNIGFLTPEYSAGIDVTDRPWAEVRGLGRSFALNRNEDLEAYMTAEELIHFFAAAVAAGGGMILNVGPQADGQIPLLQQERLVQLGDWLAVNGEAVYGSQPWEKTGEEREVALERVDPTIDFDWVRNSPGAPIREDDFTATWTGYIEPLYSESYEFSADADDGIRVWVGDELVIDQWDDTDARAVRPIQLAGREKYPFRVEYFEGKVNASVRLYWSSQNQAREIIPQAHLYTAANRRRGDGLNAVYSSLQQYMAYTTNNGNLYAITFEWPDKELALNIPEPTAGTRIELLGLDRELPWRYSGDTLLVDLSNISYGEMPGQWAWTIRLEGYGEGQ